MIELDTLSEESYKDSTLSRSCFPYPFLHYGNSGQLRYSVSHARFPTKFLALLGFYGKC